MLWVVLFPVTVGYGMVRKQLFDFRIIAKSSAAYGAVSLAITGLYAFIITFADAVVPQFGVNIRSVQVAFLFLAILAVYPLRDRMQRLVDTFFDRDRSRYRAALREISEAMVSMLSQREISDRILVAVTDTMGAESAMVLIMDESEKLLTPVAWRGEWEERETQTAIASSHPIWKQLWMRREELSRSDFDDEVELEKREACWDVFDSLEVELLVPILYGVDLLGVVAVGRKLSGDRLGADDRQMLRTLANNSAIAIENAKAFDEIAQLNETLEARVEERTRELREMQGQLMQAEKLKSLGQLVAGVAHELNNPIGFVHANLKLLDEFIVKLENARANGRDSEYVREAINKLLARSLEGTDRVKQIVQDLRSFSRTDQAGAPGRGSARGTRSDDRADRAAAQGKHPSRARVRGASGGAVLPGSVEPGLPESTDECLRGTRRRGHHHRQDRAHGSRGCASRSTTTVRAFRRRSRAGSSTRSLRPSRSDRGRGSDFRSPTASSIATVAASE